MFGLGKEADYYESKVVYVHESKRYSKTVTVPKGYFTDGATGALDVCEKAWTVHDWVCGNWAGKGPEPIGGQFDDGTPMNNWQASQIISDILAEEGHWFRQYTWLWGTWIGGGGKARENGMF